MRTWIVTTFLLAVTCMIAGCMPTDAPGPPGDGTATPNGDGMAMPGNDDTTTPDDDAEAHRLHWWL